MNNEEKTNEEIHTILLKKVKKVNDDSKRDQLLNLINQSIIILDSIPPPITPLSIPEYHPRQELNPTEYLLDDIRIIVKKERSYRRNNNFTIPGMLTMIEDRTFILKIVLNLTKLYDYKSKRYLSITETIQESIRFDESEIAKNFNLSSRHIENMFPMLVINRTIKSRTSSLAKKASNEISSITNDLENYIIKTRNNLIQAITDPENGIISILGDARDDIKSDLLKQIYILSKSHKPFIETFMNIILTGPSGIGKTKLAQVMGFFFNKIGILLQKDTLVISPSDLISMWVGHSGPKTIGVLFKGLESVIFIDEAYQMDGGTNEKGNHHGQESIAEIVNFIDKYIGLSIVIASGYKKEMEVGFLKSNKGMGRRFPIKYDLTCYSTSDLFTIFSKEVSKTLEKNVFEDEEIIKYVFTMITQLNKFNIFPNQSGDMLNLCRYFVTNYYVREDEWNSGFELKRSIINDAFFEYLNHNGATMEFKNTK